MTVNLSGIFGRRHTTAVGALVDELMASSKDIALELMPIKEEFAEYIEHEVISGFGGMTGERNYGEHGKSIAGHSTGSNVFSPGVYQEDIILTEKDLLKLRKAGTFGERGATGLTGGEFDEVERSARKLYVRIKNRMQDLIWTAIFEGKFTWKGVVYNFNIPAENLITTVSDWTDLDASTPYSDLQKILNQSGVLRKYSIEEIIINGTTAANIMMSKSVEKFITNANIQNADINEVMKFIAPNLPPFKVVKDAYQEETLVDGKVVLGDAKFFVPDNKLLLKPDFSNAEYGQYGDMVLTENLNDPSATLERPAVGTYVFVNEKGLEDRKAPKLEIVGGFNGGPNLKRSNDVLIVDATGA